ncbi:hypothetical protein LOTGIDRAFT_231660 [Lottia gigantea]|uniref:Condensin complex subunit 2 n=1 Tax=Lottia gigantea TaxID=225164 RepID=V4ASX3_LOTGI|nr:hypothetical protein LOTGIDRAFT_231660 [Lottia gigantea]ESO96826.1 hypothetical protein LOTGIDRAFT_231660 [Lottia gigantea]
MSVREPLTPLSTNNMSTPTSKRPNTASKFVSPSTSRHAHIQTPVGVFTKEHDDAAEKRDRRRSRVLELQRKAGTAGGSPISPADRRRSTPLNGLTASQLSDHYASCIKLSTENKINAKNAFGLHLIDYMSDLLQKKGLENFQVASTTLDASAKIYAGRVDFIHSETYKVLTGLGRSEKDKNKEDDGEGDENTGEAGSNAEEVNKKKRKARKSRTIETNLKNINVNKFDLEFEVDPMFQITSAAFDEGGVSGLLLNNLQCFDDSQELILDSSTQVSIIDDRNLQPRGCQPVDTGDIKELFSKLHMEEKRICPAFEDFRFTEWDGSDTSSIIPKPSSEHVFDVNAEVEPIPEPDEDNYNRDVDVLSFTGGDSDDEHHGFDPESQEETMSHVLGDNNTAKLVESAFRDLTHGSVGSLMQILASEPSDYSYFDKALLKSWAGPSHWKLGPLSKDPKNVPKNPKAKKVDYTIDYEGDVDLEKPFRKSKATTLTKATLTKHTKTQTTLPQDQHYDADKLFKLFNKPKIMIKRQTASDVGVDEAVENYDYDNANDKDNYCPADAADDDDDDDQGFNFTAACGDDSQEMTQNPSLQDTLFDGTVLAGDKLLAQPYKVAKIDIGYAKTAKKLDVRRLKGSMWKLLTKKEEEAPVQEEESENITMNTSWSFQSLLEQLPEKVSTNTAKNLSVPIAFVCLLHLANEKTLKITGEELKDLVICKD